MVTAKVLFLCTGNSARSQMAEAFLRVHGGAECEAYSAGLEPRPVHPLAVRVMAERNIDIGSQRSKSVSEYLGREHFGYVITVCDRAESACPIFPGVTIRLHWSFDDPAAIEGTVEQRLAGFRAVRDAIEAQVREWLSERRAAESER